MILNLCSYCNESVLEVFVEWSGELKIVPVDAGCYCSLCLGVFEDPDQRRMLDQVRSSWTSLARPFIGLSEFSVAVGLPGAISLRAYILSAVLSALAQGKDSKRPDPVALVDRLLLTVKQRCRDWLAQCFTACTDASLVHSSSSSNNNSGTGQTDSCCPFQLTCMAVYPEEQAELGRFFFHFDADEQQRQRDQQALIARQHQQQHKRRKPNISKSLTYSVSRLLGWLQRPAGCQQLKNEALANAAGLTEQFLQPVQSAVSWSITFSHADIFLAGRYNKFSRDVSQTEWIINGKKLAAYSVEEFICPLVMDFFQCQRITFSGSGREDFDVRMLGRGRPFVLHIHGPTKVDQLTNDHLMEIQTKINNENEGKKIQLRNFQVVKLINQSSGEKRKQYRALVRVAASVSERELSELNQKFAPAEAGEAGEDGVVVAALVRQRTPVRVSHRRAIADRDKQIHQLHCQRIDDHSFVLHLVCAAGLYVKEFVYGDFGRTRPSIQSLLNKGSCDLVLLDVMDVEVNLPNPSINPLQ